MRKAVFLAIGLLWLTGFALAQPCSPSSTKGIHVVQPGENLYRISKKYGCTVAEICGWNAISENTVLARCTELLVKTPTRAGAILSPKTDEPVRDASPESGLADRARREEPRDESPARPRAEPMPESDASSSESMSSDDVHVVVQGETVEDIARKHGYATWRFREFNALKEGEEVEPGRLLRNSECVCPSRFRRDGKSTLPGSRKPSADAGTGSWQPQPVPENRPKTDDWGRPKTDDRWTETGSAAPRKEEVVESENIRSKTRKVPTDAERAAEEAAKKSAAAPTSTRTDANFMTVEERTMVDEINLIRGNPAGYIPFVEAYIADQRKNGEMGNSISTANELIAQLRKTPKLSTLQPSECVYNAARKHGKEQVRRGDTDHQGSDGSWPWDRVLRECPGYEDGNENLVGGPDDIRRAVMLLLVDDGISNRGHRTTLLEPKWKYVACYKVGKVGQMPNCWVQNFGN